MVAGSARPSMSISEAEVRPDMAILFFDSFDHYDAAHRLLKWTADMVSAGVANIGEAGTGRNGTSGLTISRWDCALRKSVATQIGTGGIAFGYRCSLLPPTTIPIAALLDGTNTQLTLMLSSTGALSVQRGSTVLGAASALLNATVFHHIELAATIHDSTGTVDLWLDSILVLSLSGIDTQNTGNAYFDGFCLGAAYTLGYAESPTLRYDDAILWDDSGANNGPVGDCRVEAFLPSGAGATTGMDPTGAATNWEAVSEAPPDDDTSYVSTATATTFDTYALPAPSTSAGTVLAVQSVLTARKDDAGAHTVAPVYRSGGTNYDGPDLPLTTSFAMLMDVAEEDPDAAAAWTIASLAAVEVGAKLTL